jgi:RNA polymerase primary sigma factor
LAKTVDRNRQQSAALDLYLRDIARIPLLTREEEVELAIRIREGDQQALDRLVEGNLRFVVNVAKSYANQGVPLSDLINEGNLGLMRAAERFDETRGFKFISYAVWWIRQSILQALADQSRIVRVPLNRVAHIYHMGKTIQKLEQELQREPTMSEVAGEMGVKEHIVTTSGRIASAHVSLDSPGPGNDDGALLETLVDASQADVDAELLEEAMEQEVGELLGGLSAREELIVRRYFGIGGGEAQTLDAIGRELGLTRERIRQVKAKALARLLTTATERELDLFIRD